MINYNDPHVQLDDTLDKMAESIQLDETRATRMESAYKAVHSFVLEDPVFFKGLSSEVYAQGSTRIGTTNKPFKGNEFDLDTVIQLKPSVDSHTPKLIRYHLERRLGEEGSRYRKMIEPKNRCIRIRYENDFHMDVVAACQHSIQCNNTILVPTKDKVSVAISNPRGHADWFLSQSNRVLESLLEKADRGVRLKASVERLPNDNFRRKKPLQRSVQLLKRYRDIYFSKDDSYSVSSIILTTIAGQYYRGEASIYLTMDGIISRIVDDAERFKSVIGGRIKVSNPVNPMEDFTAKWDTEPEYYRAFIQFAKHLKGEWQHFKVQQGIVEENRILKGLFGEEMVNAGASLRAEEVSLARSNGQLHQDRTTGIITSSAMGGTLIKPNTFFGE